MCCIIYLVDLIEGEMIDFCVELCDFWVDVVVVGGEFGLLVVFDVFLV